MNKPLNFEAEQVIRIFDALVSDYPELAEDEDLRRDVLEGETNLDAVVTRIVEAISEAEMVAEVISLRVKDMQARKGRHEQKAEVMRRLLLSLMERLELSSFTIPTATVSVRKGQPSLGILEADLIPEGFMRVKVEPDKAAIKEAMRNGVAVPGCILTNGAPSLTLKVR